MSPMDGAMGPMGGTMGPMGAMGSGLPDSAWGGAPTARLGCVMLGRTKQPTSTNQHHYPSKPSHQPIMHARRKNRS